MLSGPPWPFFILHAPSFFFMALTPFAFYPEPFCLLSLSSTRLHALSGQGFCLCRSYLPLPHKNALYAAIEDLLCEGLCCEREFVRV